MMNHESSQPRTPPRMLSFRPDSVASSNPSTFSGHSNLNHYPAGLIRVYQSDEEGSNDSFSINSKKLYDAKSIISQMEPINLNGTDNTTSPSSETNNKNSSDTIIGKNSFISEIWSKTTDTERDSLVIPKDEKARIKYILDKVVESFESKHGVFLTADIYLNNKIYQQEETISNGSVKINIIQEITTLLKIFQDSILDLTKFNTVEPTLAYYAKIMDAFDVLQAEGLTDDGENDTCSLDSSANISANNSLQVYKTKSKDSTTNISSQSTKPQDQTDGKPKKRNSLLLGKFRDKMKNKKRASVSWEPQYYQSSPQKEQRPRSLQQLHARSVSVSSTQTQGSLRSAKDQASIDGYLEVIENLQIAWNLVYNKQVSENSETHEKLTLVVDFLTQYVIKFLLSDLTTLSLKFMKKKLRDLV